MLEPLFCKHITVKNKQHFLIQVVLTFFLIVGLAHAQVAPQLTSISPRAAQRGQTIEVTLIGKNIDESAKIWLNKEGVKAEIKKKTPVARRSFYRIGNISEHPK